MSSPKMKSSMFTPGLEVEHEVGLSGVGVCVVQATIAINTSRTAAQLIASPSNAAATVCGPVMHSLGTPPTVVIPQLCCGTEIVEGTGGSTGIQFQYCTADNSAVYIWANAWSGKEDAVRGIPVRFICIR